MLVKMYCKTAALAHSVNKFLKEETGVTSIEYAVVAAGVTALVAVVFAKGGSVDTMLSSVYTDMATKIKNITK